MRKLYFFVATTFIYLVLITVLLSCEKPEDSQYTHLPETAHSWDFQVDGICYVILSDTDYACKVTYRNYNYSGKINIPSQVSNFGKIYKVTSIGDYAFYGCSSLTSVTIPNSVTNIGNSTFHGCSSLTSVTIPNSVTNIGNSTFSNCSSLTSITLPNSVTNIGICTFYGCGFTSFTIPNHITSIGYSAFESCKSLTTIVIPSSVTSIETAAFRDCSSLTTVVIPSSVTSLGYYVFEGCSSLTSVTIPSSVTNIGSAVFFGCSMLETVLNYATTPQTIVNNPFSETFSGIKKDCKLYVPDESVDTYKVSSWKDYFAQILPMSENPSGIEEIQGQNPAAQYDGIYSICGE